MRPLLHFWRCSISGRGRTPQHPRKSSPAPSGLHIMARLAGLVVGSRSVCPRNRLRRVATVSCSAACPVRAITSSFVTWSRHKMPKMLLRHRRSQVAPNFKFSVVRPEPIGELYSASQTHSWWGGDLLPLPSLLSKNSAPIATLRDS